MLYFTSDIIKQAFDTLKGSVENKLFGILGILRNIGTDRVKSNVTYCISDSMLSNWLDDEFYLSDNYKPNNKSSNLYVKFSNQWDNYVKDEFIKKDISVYNLIIFIYKFEGFDSEPTKKELLMRFSKEFHLPFEVIDSWFSLQDINFSFDNKKLSKAECKQKFQIVNDTISFTFPFSVSSRAGELSRAPFVQTLYAGMDSIKCLLILKDDIDLYYSSGKSCISEKYEVLSVLKIHHSH